MPDKKTMGNSAPLTEQQRFVLSKDCLGTLIHLVVRQTLDNPKDKEARVLHQILSDAWDQGVWFKLEK